ncbi:MAG: hypothetical protein ACLU4N_00565 [Butyricimonas faecihominis]
MHEADSLLEVSDSKSFKIPNTYDKDYNAFESSRQLRMNVYAVRAMLARVYLYKGDADSKAKALTYAREVVESDYFGLHEDNSNPVLFGEHIFGLMFTSWTSCWKRMVNIRRKSPRATIRGVLYLADKREF